MNRKNIIWPLAIIVSMACFSIAQAADTNISAGGHTYRNIDAQAPNSFNMPPFHNNGSVKGSNPDEFTPPPPPDMQFKRPSKEEMEAKKVEFEKRLKLTDKQKKQIELQKQQDREKMKPIINDIRIKKQEFKSVLDDKSLSKADKDKKIKEIKSSMKELKDQADSLRKENMENFENLLTEKQKKEFEKIKKEQKQEMEQRKKDFEKNVQNK